MSPTQNEVDGHIRGAAVREFFGWVAETWGDERLREIVGRLDSDAAKHFDAEARALGVLTSTWYDAKVVHALVDSLLVGVSAAERERIAHEGADAVMKRTLRGVYKLLFDWMATPARYAKYAHKLWDSYYDAGTVEITMPEPGFAVSVVRDWRAHHPFVCDLNREASRAIYQAMRCRDVTATRTHCVDRGDAECRFETRWTP
jgi:predicted hydrocarbon binding protein